MMPVISGKICAKNGHHATGERGFSLCTVDDMKIIARNGESLEEGSLSVDGIGRLMIDGRLYLHGQPHLRR
ncbi:MAG: hypothetical protein OXF02_01115 [Simkaniaceae bacterium]|nr:hypothetical protein [Simkaniaceae bacterium]